MPRVLNKYRDRIPPGARYIGRPGPYGNQFIVGVHGSRGECVQLHLEWICKPEQARLRKRIRAELRGHDLVCFCKPRSCHGDVLLAIANS